MAVSKVKPITKTLKKAIDYIINPEKTDGGALVSSFGCSVPTADIEMSITGEQGSQQGDRIAYHLMQAFSPDDDITPEEAHRIGKEFAQSVLGGKYEFVIATHIDKDHIHNHIIFNATDYVYHKKYHANPWEYKRIRRENDKLCRENGLHVIEETAGYKGKSWYEYERSKAGESWKDKLKISIDEAVKKANSFQDFLLYMEMEGYEIKRGKHISFKAAGQIRSTRSKTIGSYYTEEMICKRIENKEFYQGKEQERETKKESKSKKSKEVKRNKINLIVDIAKCAKANESTAYKRAVVKGNINSLGNTMNYLIKNNLKTIEQLEYKINNVVDVYKGNDKMTKDLEMQMQTLSEKIKFTQNFFKFSKVGRQAKRETAGSEFLVKNEKEIILFNAAEIYMKRNEVNIKDLNLKEMFDEYRSLKEKHTYMDKEKTEAKKLLKELRIIQKNVEAAFNIKLKVDNDEEQNQAKNRERDISK